MTIIQKTPVVARHSDKGPPAAYEEAAIGELRSFAGKFLADLYDAWGKPEWFLLDTRFAQDKLIPDQILVRDYLAILGNIARYSSDPGYFIDYVMAGVPYFRGGIELGLQSAPNILAALELISRYAKYRPGYHRYVLLNDGGRVGLELAAMIDLGPGRPIIVGTPLLAFTRIARRCLGHPVSDAIVELQHGPPAYSGRFQDAIGCEVRYHAPRDAVSFPAEWGLRPSLTYDADLWRTAVYRCEEEGEQNRAIGVFVFNIRSSAATFLAENGRPPRLAELAQKFGVSSRTMVRRLRSDEQTYQGVIELLLKGKSVELLAQSNLAISEISERLGFADPSSFYRSFRRWYGMTPTQFRSRQQQ